MKSEPGTDQPRPRKQPQPRVATSKPDDGKGDGEDHGAAEPSPAPRAEVSSTANRLYNAPPVPSSRVVAKPTPAQDPRRFQVGQVVRRFSAVETTSADGGATVLAFSLTPSDPDFPFELPKGLKCVLHIPSSYLQEGGLKPWLEVKNAEMGRGYQINVERGFGKIVERSPSLGLLGWMKELDKGLEGMLVEQKAEVVTFVPNVKMQKQEQKPNVDPGAAEAMKAMRAKVSPPQPSHTPAELQEASSRRESETRQLEARIGRLPLFSKSSDGIAYTVPIAPRKPAELPVPLQGVKTVNLYVPMLYPLQHCRIELQGVGRNAARRTETGFEKRAKDEKGVNLMGHVNWLAQSMHVLATAPDPEPEPAAIVNSKLQNLAIQEPDVVPKAVARDEDEDDRSHIKVIPRPPEWSIAHGDGEDSSDSYDSGDEFSDEDHEDEEHGVKLPNIPEASSTALPNPERGIALNFPSLELYGIELLELTSLSITIKCERCKDTMDISSLRSAISATNPTKPRTESCKKCATPFSITYRHELMHPHSFRAGYLDLEGCTVVDMLPSTFIPTCSVCSTPCPPPGITSVRGASSMGVCRECHHKISFLIPEIKFLLVSSAARSNLAPTRKKPKENLGIVAGTELPRRGRCSHYSKSYRWFRFSCCQKVYACDRCHDEAEGHPNEHANRMICGFCSREQNYRPGDCGMCHMSVVKKTGSGFWEGGKGTRDKTKMSRKGTSLSCLICFLRVG